MISSNNLLLEVLVVNNDTENSLYSLQLARLGFGYHNQQRYDLTTTKMQRLTFEQFQTSATSCTHMTHLVLRLVLGAARCSITTT